MNTWLLLSVAVAIVVGWRLRSVSLRRSRSVGLVERCVPDLVDLLGVAAAAGHTPHRCLQVVAERAPPPLRGPLVDVRTRIERGEPLESALEQVRSGLGRLGDPIADALLESFRSGTPLVAALDRVGAVAVDTRRRDAETRARRLPVLLLFPLVACILPAFGLLAVVPMVAVSLGAIF